MIPDFQNPSSTTQGKKKARRIPGTHLVIPDGQSGPICGRIEQSEVGKEEDHSPSGKQARLPASLLPRSRRAQMVQAPGSRLRRLTGGAGRRALVPGSWRPRRGVRVQQRHDGGQQQRRFPFIPQVGQNHNLGEQGEGQGQRQSDARDADAINANFAIVAAAMTMVLMMMV